MRMLSGILLRRDCAVAMEAYSEAFRADSIEEAAVESHARWCDVEDELGRRSHILAELSQCFEDLFHRTALLLCTSATGGVDFIPPETGVPCRSSSLSWEHTRQLRKLLCWCSLHMLCASDLPVELPTLLLWALSSNINAIANNNSGYGNDGPDGLSELQLAPSFGQAAPRNNPAVAKLGLLRCLRMYLCSPAEEVSADWLRRNSVLWSAYGLPRLAAPHTRRSGAASYEQDMADSLERATKFLNEEDEEQQDDEEEGETRQRREKQRTPDSVAEAFALQCRWSRISAIVSRGSIIGLLASHAITAVEALLDAASDKKSFSTSGDVITALGMASLQLLALIARQGNDDVLPVLYKQFLRPSWKAFVAMSDSEHVRSTESDLHALFRCWWLVLAELVVRDRAIAVFLFDTHAEWTDPVVLRLLLQNVDKDQNTEVPGTDSVGSVVLRVLKSSLVFGLGFRCVTELLMADQVTYSAASVSTTSYSQVDVLTLLEQAAVSASAVLSSTERSIATTGGSRVPFTLPKALEEVTQASSSILAFVKRQWNRLQSTVLNSTQNVEAKAAVLSLLSTIFSGARDPTSTVFEQHSKEIEAAYQMTESLGAASCCLRGCGLIRSAVQFNAQLLAQEQQKAGGGSVTAAMLHLSGQGSDLARFASDQEVFDSAAVIDLIEAQCAAGVVIRRGSVDWLHCQEYILCLLRHLTCTVDLLKAGSALLDPSTVEGLVRSADRCCSALETPFSLFAKSGVMNNASAVRAASGSVGEGVLMWHYQRIQQAGLILQVTGTAALLRRLPLEMTIAKSLSDALDGLLASHLHSLTANSHCSILMALFRAYLRRLVFASQSNGKGAMSVSADRYEENTAFHKSLCELVSAKAFGFDANQIESLAQGGISGTPLCRAAGDWLVLRGPGGSAIALKSNWAYEVLMGDLSSDHLADWLQVLLAQQTQRTVAASSIHAAHDDALLASQIYTLLKLSVSDQAQKWAVGTEKEQDGAVIESNQRAVQVYRMLLIQLVSGIDQSKNTSSFTAVFCQTVSKEYFATTGMMSAHRHKARAARSGPAKYTSLEGILDLCEKALDAGLNQVVDEQLHAVVLVVLCSPLLPWAIRQRVWSQLASLRLVHLLEDKPTLLPLLPVLIPFLQPSFMPSKSVEGERFGPLSPESHSLYMEIINALSDLRSVEDRSWSITAVCIVQMTHFVFGGTSVYLCDESSYKCSNQVRGQRAQLLLHLLELRDASSENAWISEGVLLHAASMHARSQHCRGVDQLLLLDEIVEEVSVACCEAGKEGKSSTSAGEMMTFTKDLQVELGDGRLQQLFELAVRVQL